MEYSQDIMNRLKRVEGQVKGILKMMEAEKDCHVVVAQITAAKNALSRTNAVVVSSNLQECVRKQVLSGDNNPDSLIDTAVNLLVKSS